MNARLEDLQRSFARHLRAEGRSDRTVVVYGQAITSFSRWLEAQGREATVDEMTRAAIREWLAHLSDINEASTVKTRYCGLFRFCSWLVDEDEIHKNPMKTPSPPRPKMKPVPILSDGDLAALLKARWAHLDALMLTQRGALSSDGVRERMNVRAAKAGLDHLHPHQFRHTFAHDFLMNGATGARPETARRMVFRCDARTV